MGIGRHGANTYLICWGENENASSRCGKAFPAREGIPAERGLRPPGIRRAAAAAHLTPPSFGKWQVYGIPAGSYMKEREREREEGRKRMREQENQWKRIGFNE